MLVDTSHMQRELKVRESLAFDYSVRAEAAQALGRTGDAARYAERAHMYEAEAAVIRSRIGAAVDAALEKAGV